MGNNPYPPLLAPRRIGEHPEATQDKTEATERNTGDVQLLKDRIDHGFN